MSGAWPMLDRAERDRRWARARAFMAERDLDCLVIPGGRSRESLDSYLANEPTAGCGTTVFPRTSDPVFIMLGANRLFCRADVMEREVDHWIADFRIGMPSEVISQVIAERGLQRARIGIVGLESIGPAGEEEGTVSHQFWARLSGALPEADWIDVSGAFCNLIARKSEREIALIRHGAAVGEQACQAFVAAARAGAAESELIAAAMAEIYRGGAFPVPPGFLLRCGPEIAGHAPPHWIAPRREARRLAPGDMVLAEFFTVYGGIETQQQLTLTVGPPSSSQRFVAEVARRSYEAGLAALRPGARFTEVFAAMQAPILAAGCWHINPLIHRLAPLDAWGGMLDGLDNQTGIEPELRALRPTSPIGDFIVEPDMIFAVEPSVAVDKERVTVGATVLTDRTGCEELNTIGTQLVVVPG